MRLGYDLQGVEPVLLPVCLDACITVVNKWSSIIKGGSRIEPGGRAMRTLYDWHHGLIVLFGVSVIFQVSPVVEALSSCI
jgi:hypothetical protein